tara:strand:+ start:12719 stop:12907 length:189 start_codon:yes stop_codon:yes gene_type:complete
MMNTNDSDLDMSDDNDDIFIDEKLDNEKFAFKRDVRAEIEKKLELLALKKNTGDFYDDLTFN